MDKPLARSPYSVLLHVPNRGPVLFDTLSGSLVGLDSRAERAWTTDINMFTPEEISTLEKRGHLVDGLSFDKMLDNLSESYAKSMPNKSIFNPPLHVGDGIRLRAPSSWGSWNRTPCT